LAIFNAIRFGELLFGWFNLKPQNRWYLGRLTKTLCLFQEWCLDPEGCLHRWTAIFRRQACIVVISCYFSQNGVLSWHYQERRDIGGQSRDCERLPHNELEPLCDWAGVALVVMVRKFTSPFSISALLFIYIAIKYFRISKIKLWLLHTITYVF